MNKRTPLQEMDTNEGVCANTWWALGTYSTVL